MTIIQSALQHLKARLVAHVVRDIECDLAALDAERRAELLRQAEQHEEWGHEQVGHRLRACALATELQLDHPQSPKLTHKESK